MDYRLSNILHSMAQRVDKPGQPPLGIPPGSLMHAKFMHELCSLFMHIPAYLDVIIMFCIDL
jgi:hypothetical protein